jgi:SAM-dependent methyltransferase
VKLTKEQAKAHREACRLVALDRELTEDEREFVLINWHEGANPDQALDGAFFTPADLASDLRLEVGGQRVIDLCAGIGRLAFHARDLWSRRWEGAPPRELVCVERNPAFVAVGRRVLPEARWICADVLDLPAMDLGRFDTAISNPPFGRIARTGDAPGYTGPRFEYHVIAVAATLARRGAFILPQASAPFRYSGEHFHREERDRECARFEAQTGIRLSAGVGIDTTAYADGWRDVSPRIEVAVCDFPEPAPMPVVRPGRPVARPVEQLDLFA